MQKPILVSKSTFDASLSETIRKNMTKKKYKECKKSIKKTCQFTKNIIVQK